MDRYVKTDLGIQALKQRSFQLNARQRQLLLLIGTDDFRVLNGAMKQRLATPEIIQQLEQLGLIFQKNIAQTHPAENSFERNTYNKDIPLFENTEKKNTHWGNQISYLLSTLRVRAPSAVYENLGRWNI